MTTTSNPHWRSGSLFPQEESWFQGKKGSCHSCGENKTCPFHECRAEFHVSLLRVGRSGLEAYEIVATTEEVGWMRELQNTLADYE